MGKRFAIVIGVAALGAALIAAGASAGLRSVHDPRGDVECKVGVNGSCSDSMRRNADIVRATAGHEGTRLKHTIRVDGKFRSVHLLINTDSETDCEWSLFVSRGEQPQGGECIGQGGVIRHARVDFHSHSGEISFSKRSIGNPASYGWTAYTLLGDSRASTFDHVPNGRSLFDYIEHSLG